MTSHVNSQAVCKAFAEGSPGRIVPPAPLRRGDVFMYGALRGLQATLRQAHAEGRNWYYADNGYLKPGHFEGYYRITRNAYQHNGIGESDGKRFAALGMSLKPWRTTGSHILVCPPGQIWAELTQLSVEAWTAATLAEVGRSGRPVRLRTKAAAVSLSEDLRDAWVLVTYTSNAAVLALLAGVPVICTGPCAAQSMSGTLEDLEDLPMLDRERWLGVLADNQFLLSELRSGFAWEKLINGGTK